MPYYRRVGAVPAKRHTQHCQPDGSLYLEELMGADGFFSDSSLLYHCGVPSAITDSVPWQIGDMSTSPNHPLKPLHLRLHALFPGDNRKARDAVTGRRLLLGNASVRISYVVAGEASPLYRNVVGDECVFVEAGAATVETMLGSLPARQGDYVIMPKATTHRWIPESPEPLRCYVIEACSHITPPTRYLSPRGQFLEHAPYCERDLHAPEEPLMVSEGNVEVLVKHRTSRGEITGSRLCYAAHPFDVAGWDGCLYPYTFNITDFEPITGRVHQPPPVHQVFEGTGFVVCNFVPRKLDYHPLAIPVPFYHTNADCDEVMFYCAGDYRARRGSAVGRGSVTLHPSGHSHGPQPGAAERSIGTDYTDELAVMIDTFRPLDLGEGAFASCDDAYPWTWATPR